MIVVRTHPLEDAALIAAALPEEPMIRAADQRQVRVALREAELAILGYRGRFLEEHLAELSRVARDFALAPVILVTDRIPRVARQTATMSLAAVNWYEALDQLPETLDRVRLTSALEEMAQAVEGSRLPPKLRVALSLALRRANDLPFKTVEALATAAGCTPVTIRQEFRAAAPEGYTAANFLAALLALRAMHLHRTGMAWKAIFPELGYSRRAFERLLASWPSRGCKDLALMYPRELIARFLTERLAPILRRFE